MTGNTEQALQHLQELETLLKNQLEVTQRHLDQVYIAKNLLLCSAQGVDIRYTQPMCIPDMTAEEAKELIYNANKVPPIRCAPIGNLEDLKPKPCLPAALRHAAEVLKIKMVDGYITLEDVPNEKQLPSCRHGKGVGAVLLCAETCAFNKAQCMDSVTFVVYDKGLLE